MKKIGILGGTFNPIHNGHISVAKAAYEKLELDQIIFVPCAKPPHKDDTELLNGQIRYAMVELAIKEYPNFIVSDFEINRGGKSYSINTIKALRDDFTEKVEMFFIIGQDNFAGLKKWKDADELKGLCSFIVINRDNHKVDCSQEGFKVINVKMSPVFISSSEIRDAIRDGLEWDKDVPKEVVEYIQGNKLYI